MIYDFVIGKSTFSCIFHTMQNRISLNLSLLFVFVGLAVISGHVFFLGDGVVLGCCDFGG